MKTPICAPELRDDSQKSSQHFPSALVLPEHRFRSADEHQPGEIASWCPQGTAPSRLNRPGFVEALFPERIEP